MNKLMLVAVLAAAPLRAQVGTVDEGSFTISRGGERIGSETFSIRQTPGTEGALMYVATATVAYDGRRLTPALRTDPRGTPVAYQIETKVGAETQERLKGMIGRGRFSAQVQTPRGESAKEYVVADGALVIDDDVFHQYYFIARARGTVPAVVPRRGLQITLTVTEQGTETVNVGGQSVSATKVSLSERGGPERLVWVDAQGRVLRVEIPARGIVAARDQMPR